MNIRKLETSDGHLQGVPLEFADGLNCIIGARGTCKSTIVETIRFVFDDDEERVSALLDPAPEPGAPGHAGLVHATLRGGTARVVLAGEREAEILERDTTSGTRLYIDGVKAIDHEHDDLQSGVEVYSQGELQEIAVSPEKRLALVDQPHRAEIEGIRTRAQDVASEIAGLGPQIRDAREAVRSAERQLEQGEAVREDYQQAQQERPALPDEFTVARERHREREALQERAETVAGEYLAERREIEAALARMRGINAELLAPTGSNAGALGELGKLLSEAPDSAARLLAELPGDDVIRSHLESAEKEFAADAAAYATLLQREQEVTEAIRREDRLAEEVAKLDRLSSELSDRQRQLETLLAERTKCREELAELRNLIFRLRLDEVERINSEFSDQIVLTLNHGTHRQAYREELDRLLSGSWLRDQPSLCHQIASILPPQELVSLVDADDATGLAELLDRDAGQMMRLISHVADEDAFYDLERQVADDELDITMFVDGVPKPVQEMSKGQQATAILPLVLRDADYPLILDQPEDDLDNAFIFSTLVEKVASLKQTRQLIFVTHNANIPVVGDAECVFVMAMQGPDEATLETSGSVDDTRDQIINLLEGGREAFEFRSKIYGYDDS